jgi:hypothetical protein
LARSQVHADRHRHWFNPGIAHKYKTISAHVFGACRKTDELAVNCLESLRRKHLVRHQPAGLLSWPVSQLALPIKVIEPLDDNQLRALLGTCAGRSFADRRDGALNRLMLDTAARHAAAGGPGRHADKLGGSSSPLPPLKSQTAHRDTWTSRTG